MRFVNEYKLEMWTLININREVHWVNGFLVLLRILFYTYLFRFNNLWNERNVYPNILVEIINSIFYIVYKLLTKQIIYNLTYY